MSLWSRTRSWLRAAFSPTRTVREMDEEFRFHIQAYADDLVRGGISRDDAVRQARAQFGGVEWAKEESRDALGARIIETLWQDARYALRTLRKNPGFTTVAVLTLGLGIGANTAIFSVIESVLLRQLPFERAERIFAVWQVSADGWSQRGRSSGPDVQDFMEQSRTLDHVAAVVPRFRITWTGQGDPRTVICTGISSSFFPLLGVKPLLGRLYTSEEYHVDGAQAVISERFWREQLGGDPHVIGRVLHLDDGPMTVIGVMPTLSDLFADTELWAKISPDYPWMQSRGNKLLTVFARLNGQATLAQAEQELTTILRRVPGESAKSSVKLTPLRDELVGPIQLQLQVVMACVGLVLMITCLNVAYLLFARATRRRPEIAVRLGIGASRRRILQQVFTEHLTLVLWGGGLGVVLAYGLVSLLRRFYVASDAQSGQFGVAAFSGPFVAGLPRGQTIAIDGTALAFALIVTLLSALLLSWWVSAAFSKVDVTATLKSGRAPMSASRQLHLRALLASEISLAIVLAVTAGLLTRSFWQLQRVDPGFQRQHVLTAYFRTNYYSQDGGAFFNRVIEGVSQLPGVRAAAVAGCMPGTSAATASLAFDDRVGSPNSVPTAEACWISAEFFPAIGAPLISGRAFAARDDAHGPPVAVVNKRFAEQYWPGRDPLGQRVAVNFAGAGHQGTGTIRYREVVGVVGNIRQDGLDQDPRPAIYTPFLQDETNHDFTGMNLFIRSADDPLALAVPVRRVVGSVQPDQPIDMIRTMDDVLSATLVPRRFSATLLAAFAALALLLSAVGIYGLAAYSVNMRTSEFGLRMALGASRAAVLQLVLAEGMQVALVGVGLGVLGSLLFARFVRALLYGVSQSDPLTYLGTAALLCVVAIGACYLPARRATRADPAAALRCE